MIIGLILAGGTGTRLGGDIPKQYIEVAGKPIIAYCLNKFQQHELIDIIIIVADETWHMYIQNWIKKDNISKFIGFAKAGSSRQHSIVNGLKFAEKKGATEDDFIIIHDAARPKVSLEILTKCIEGLYTADGVMPVLPVKDTIYFSKDGSVVDSLLDRDKLFAGQTPESFIFGKYIKIHEGMREKELKGIKGSSEIAYCHGLKINMITGDENNYKITTIPDLEKFRMEIK